MKQIKHEIPDTTAGPPQKRAKCSSPVQYGQCPRCDMPVRTVAAFKKHANQHHPEFVFFCHRPGCYAAYNTPAGMRAHVKKHQSQDGSSSKPTSTSTSPSIQCVTERKRKTASPSEVTCDRCQKSFSRPDTLRQHITVQHAVSGVAPTPFRCQICNKAFSHRSSHHYHMKHSVCMKNAINLE